MEGIEVMKANRGGADRDNLTNGPGKLTEALGIKTDKNGEDFVESEDLWFSSGKSPKESEIESSGRIGEKKKKKEQLRFFLEGNRFVSGN